MDADTEAAIAASLSMESLSSTLLHQTVRAKILSFPEEDQVDLMKHYSLNREIALLDRVVCALVRLDAIVMVQDPDMYQMFRSNLLQRKIDPSSDAFITYLTYNVSCN